MVGITELLLMAARKIKALSHKLGLPTVVLAHHEKRDEEKVNK
jgi:hypothetical protein